MSGKLVVNAVKTFVDFVFMIYQNYSNGYSITHEGWLLCMMR